MFHNGSVCVNPSCLGVCVRVCVYVWYVCLFLKKSLLASVTQLTLEQHVELGVPTPCSQKSMCDFDSSKT